jgi:hypothetical protein
VTVVRVPPCTHCGGCDSERVGQFGGQLITSHWRCRTCGTYYEAIREELEDDAPVADPVPAPGGAGEPG